MAFQLVDMFSPAVMVRARCVACVACVESPAAAKYDAMRNALQLRPLQCLGRAVFTKKLRDSPTSFEASKVGTCQHHNDAHARAPSRRHRAIETRLSVLARLFVRRHVGTINRSDVCDSLTSTWWT